ncbi:MAG: T9SS type A sorting domain-containing protein, partial [Cyclobacteriaceae bacterium]|nr:T9SS type A sorting domain-containing protein [Cyclobacteriaceae bacterium]
NGSGVQSVSTPSAGGSFQGNLDYIIETNAIVDLGTSVLSNTSGMLQVKGRVRLGSSHPLGAIQLESNGNIHVQGTRIFENGSSIEYNGSVPQFIGNGHPSSMGVNLICNNQTDITLLQDVTVGGDFYQMAGSLQATPFALNVYGDLTLQEGVLFQAEIIRLLGDQNQAVSAKGTSFKDLYINKSGNANVKLLSPLALEGIVLIESENTILDANGYLTLLSTTDQAFGNACIGQLPNGSGVIGNVTIQRYMSGEGRIYRYISSPVQNATVAALMDDFPVTGLFGDPSTGIGIDSNSPSFYFYDESVGGLQEGWRPYPTVGLAGTNPLEAGRGYAAFIRQGSGATIWDVTGNLNQGEISLPVTFTPGGTFSNGWNLVGNPYACTIDWDVSGADGWTKQHISNVIAIRDNGGGGIFHYWDGDVNYVDIPNGQIAAGQSMWVRATDVDPVLVVREGSKVTNGAAFYRVSPAYIPSFALTLKKGTLEDKAYVKVRENASPGLDDWDALKMDNDNFSLSILSGDSIPMAIDARNNLPCNTEILSLVLADLTMGTYSFSLTTKFDFANFTYTLIDHYLNRETVLLFGREVEFVVTKVHASFARDRFALRLDEIMPDSTRKVAAPAVVCSEEVIPVLIENAQAGIYYTLWTKNGRQLSGEWIGDDADLRIEVPADSLQPGAHTLVVSARNTCKQELLSGTITITKEKQILLSVVGGTGCAGSAVTLTASSESDDLTYSWFEARDASDTLARGDQWVTPPITKRKAYFVSGLGRTGCVSERYPVVAEIIPFDSAKITWVGAAFLSSNYAMGNQWYHDGQILSDEVDQQIELKAPGKYSLHVAVNGCITSDSVEFTITGMNHAAPRPFNLFPNPVEDRLIIEGTDGDVEMIEIIDAMGIAVHRLRADDMKDGKGTIVISISGLASGMYLAVITCKTASQFIRFVKRR